MKINNFIGVLFLIFIYIETSYADITINYLRKHIESAKVKLRNNNDENIDLYVGAGCYWRM